MATDTTYPKSILELANRIRTAAKYHGVSINKALSDIEGVLIEDEHYKQDEYLGTYAASYKGQKQRLITIPAKVKPALKYHCYITEDERLIYCPAEIPEHRLSPIVEA